MAHPNAITEKELNTAKKMAKRKAGMTRIQLAERLKIDKRRAGAVIRRLGEQESLTEQRAGKEAGKGANALIYRLNGS